MCRRMTRIFEGAVIATVLLVATGARVEAASWFQGAVDHVVLNTDFGLLKTVEGPVLFDYVNGTTLAGAGTVLADYKGRVSFSYAPLKKVKTSDSVQHHLLLAVRFDDLTRKHVPILGALVPETKHIRAEVYGAFDFSKSLWRAGLKGVYRFGGRKEGS